MGAKELGHKEFDPSDASGKSHTLIIQSGIGPGTRVQIGANPP